MTPFPIEHRLLLKPWFSAQALNQAEAEKRPGPRVIVYRQAVAGVYANERGWGSLKFEEAPQISQGFRLVEAACSLCVLRRRNGDLCSHLAVLASRVLVPDAERIVSLPLVYATSRWAGVARFLGQHGAGVAIGVGSDGLRLTNEAFMVQARLTEEDLALARGLFPDLGWPEPPGSDADRQTAMIQEVWQHLKESVRTDSEAVLNRRGLQSQGQRLAGSLWSFLGQAFLGLAPTPSWRLARDEAGLFSLAADSPAGPGIVTVTPNRDLLIELLQQAGVMDLIEMTAKARAYSKIYFDSESGDLLIEPWLETADGSRHRREDIADSRFGRYYSLTGRVFFAVDEQDNDFPDEEESTLPLFAAARPVPCRLRTVVAEDVPRFVKRHHQAMLTGGHDLDPSLIDFTVADLPDCLEIVDYREDGHWCLLDARYGFGSNRVELTDVLRLRQAGGRHVAGRRAWLQIDNTPLGWLHALGPERLGSFRSPLVPDGDGYGDGDQNFLRLTRREMMALTALVPRVIYPAQEEVRAIVRRRLASDELPDLADDEMPGHLRHYQRQGLALALSSARQWRGRRARRRHGAGQDPSGLGPPGAVGPGRRPASPGGLSVFGLATLAGQGSHILCRPGGQGVLRPGSSRFRSGQPRGDLDDLRPDAAGH